LPPQVLRVEAARCAVYPWWGCRGGNGGFRLWLTV